MARREAQAEMQSASGIEKQEEGRVALQVSRVATEITDADYRTIFLPCEALEERKTGSGTVPDPDSTRRE